MPWSTRFWARGPWVFVLCACFALSVARADVAWQRVRQDEGITTWMRARAGEALPDYRAEAVLDVDVWHLLAVLEDVGRACEWTASCEEMRRVERLGERDLLVYARMHAPWPVQDRDVTTRVRVRFDGPGALTIDIRRSARQPVPPSEGVVRMPRFVASYAFQMLPSGGTRVVYDATLDPGGSLPEWLKGILARRFPHETLSRLRDRVHVVRARGTYAARVRELRAAAVRDGFLLPGGVEPGEASVARADD